MGQTDDEEDVPSFSSRSFDVTLFTLSVSDQRDRKAFEGETDFLHRYGMKVHVNEIGQFDQEQADWTNEKLLVKFHAIPEALSSLPGRVLSVEEAEDMRYELSMDIHFEEELELLKVHLE